MRRHSVYLRGGQMTSLINTVGLVGSGPDSQRNNNDYALGSFSSHRVSTPCLRRDHVIAGYKAGSPVSTDAQRMYDFPADSWTTLAASGTIAYVTWGGSINRWCYQIGGYSGSAGVTVNKEYDPFSDAFATMTALSAATWSRNSYRYPMGASEVVAAGGSNAAGIFAATDSYHRGTDAYVSLGAMSVNRTNGNGVSLGNIATYANGYNGSANVNECRTYSRGADAWTNGTGPGSAWREACCGNEGVKAMWHVGYYVSGSSGSTSCYSYNAGTDTWTSRNGASTAIVGPPGMSVSCGRIMKRGPSSIGLTAVQGYYYSTEAEFNMTDCTTNLGYNWTCNQI